MAVDHAMIRQLTRIARRTGFSVATTATHRLGVLGRTENVAEVQHIVLPERLQRRPTA